jgi:hypothetical protein
MEATREFFGTVQLSDSGEVLLKTVLVTGLNECVNSLAAALEISKRIGSVGAAARTDQQNAFWS